jgi:MFS family permease
VRLASNIAAFLLFGAFWGFIFAGTLLMQYDMGYSPTRTGLAWLATSLTAFAAAALTGARLVTVFGPRRLITIGTALVAVAAAWLSQSAGGQDFATDLLPPFLLAGVGVGFSAPAIQIGALTGARGRTEGIASGLVETMREVGSAVGVAAVATALASRTVDADGRFTADNGVQFLVVMTLAIIGSVIVSLVLPDQLAPASAPAVITAEPVPRTAAGE